MPVLTGARRRRAKRAITYLLVSFVAAVMALPVLWLVLLSIRPEQRIFEESILPTRVDLSAYGAILTSASFLTPLRNSLLVGASSTALALALGLPAAYALSRFRFRGKAPVLVVLIGTKLFPPITLAVGYFVIVASLGLFDSLLSVILMDAVMTLPLATWMIMNYFDSVPTELDDAAIVDGCTRLGALLRVVIPVSLPGIAAAAVYCFVLAWNEFLFALIFLRSAENQLTTVRIAFYLGEFYPEYSRLLAYGVIFAVPPVVLFLVMQRFLVRGLTSGALR